MTLRHIGSSKGQLEKIILEAPPEELSEQLTQRLSEWDEKRADKIGRRESVQAGAAIAATAWAAAGVSFLVWRTVGQNCPLCNRMNGRRTAIAETFLDKGDTVKPLYSGNEEPLDDDPRKTNPLKVRKSIRHPPLHRGCACLLTPGR